MIMLEYLGKKGPFVLSLPFLSKKYEVPGPKAEVVMTNEDATNMMAVNPRMFRVIGIAQEEVAKPYKPVNTGKPVEERPTAAATPPADVPDGEGAPAVPPAKATEADEEEARKMLDDDPPNLSQGEPEVPLTGDGVEGVDEPAVPTGQLMSYKTAELRAYALKRFNHEFEPEVKRMGMVKKIKELEQTKAQAAT